MVGTAKAKDLFFKYLKNRLGVVRGGPPPLPPPRRSAGGRPIGQEITEICRAIIKQNKAIMKENVSRRLKQLYFVAVPLRIIISANQKKNYFEKKSAYVIVCSSVSCLIGLNVRLMPADISVRSLCFKNRRLPLRMAVYHPTINMACLASIHLP